MYVVFLGFLVVSTLLFALMVLYLRTFYSPDSIAETIRLKRKQAMAALLGGGVNCQDVASTAAAEVRQLETKLFWATHVPYSVPAILWAISNFTFMYYYL